MTSAQAERLCVGPYRQMSPHLEHCCLRISANVSYAQAAEDVRYLTGIRVPAKTQQRLVQAHDFA
ncbi:MAG: ISKra4 family transposase, partial [Cyanobacteria bacterium J06638_22]